MKKLILILLSTLIFLVMYGQDKQKHLSIMGGIGYTSENERILGSSHCDLQYNVGKDIQPFISMGWNIHNTLNEASDYGHLSIGLETKYIAVSGGLLAGNNQQKRDIHILPTGERKVLKEGAPTSNFTGHQFTIRLNAPIVEDTMSAFAQVAFANGKTMYRAVQFYHLGVRIYIC